MLRLILCYSATRLAYLLLSRKTQTEIREQGKAFSAVIREISNDTDPK